MNEGAEYAEKVTKKSPKRASGKQLAIFLVVVVAVIVGWVLLDKAQPKAKYEVTDKNFTVVDPQTVSVSFRVKNTGNADGTPYCQVNAHDDSSDHYGGNSGKLDKQVKAGDSIATAMPVTITKQGADTVTTADVTCN